MGIAFRWGQSVQSHFERNFRHFHKTKYVKIEENNSIPSTATGKDCARMPQAKIKSLFAVLVMMTLVLLLVTFVMDVPVFGSTRAGGVNLEPANLIWEKTYGGSGDDRAFSAAKAGDGYLVVGSSTSFGENATVGWVLKIDAVGAVIWNITFPAEHGSEFRQVLGLDDGFLLVGNVFQASGSQDGYVVRLDNEGQVTWNLTVGGEGVDKLFAGSMASDGFVIAGLTYGVGGDSDVWVVKVSGSGSLVWQKTYGDSASDDAARSIFRDSDYFYVAGYTNEKAEQDYDFLLLKLDATGTLVWKHTYGGAQSDKAYAIAKASDGYVLVGDTHSKGNGDSDGWAIKVGSDGNVEWDAAFGGKDFDQATSVANSADGGFLVGGFTFSFGNCKRDFWLTKLDGSGREVWSCTQGGVNYEEAYVVLDAGQDEFVMAGWRNYVEGGPYDYYVVKISPASESGAFPSYVFVGWTVLAVVVSCVAGFVVLRTRKKKLVEL